MLDLNIRHIILDLYRPRSICKFLNRLIKLDYCSVQNYYLVFSPLRLGAFPIRRVLFFVCFRIIDMDDYIELRAPEGELEDLYAEGDSKQMPQALQSTTGVVGCLTLPPFIPTEELR